MPLLWHRFKIMKTDWKNYRPLEGGEIIRYGDHQLMPDSEEWDEIDACRIGKPASDPLKMGHMNYRRIIKHNDQVE